MVQAVIEVTTFSSNIYLFFFSPDTMANTDHARVKALLTEAIRMLCKSSLPYKSELNIEGLLGITLDNNDIFLVNIHENVYLDNHHSSINRIQPPKPVKRLLSIVPTSQSEVQLTPNATAISSLPGSRDDVPSPPEKRPKHNPLEEVTGHVKDGDDSDGTLVDVKSEHGSTSGELVNEPSNMKETEIASLDFGDMLAKYVPDEESHLDPQFLGDDNQKNYEQKPNVSYDFNYDNNDASHTAPVEDDDIVVVKAEMGRQRQPFNTPQPSTNFSTNSISSNLLTHDEYITSVDNYSLESNNMSMNVSNTSRRGRGAGRSPARGRGSSIAPPNFQDTSQSSGIDPKQVIIYLIFSVLLQASKYFEKFD